MPSNSARMNEVAAYGYRVALACALGLFAGCAVNPNQFREDGPAAGAQLESETARDVYARFQPSRLQPRDWKPNQAVVENGSVVHGPTYMENPFVDKGHGRTGRNVYYIGWEDLVSALYDYPRFTVNWLGIPVSLIATPPWTPLKSDGELSRQALGYDHDAAPLAPLWWEKPPPPSPESQSASPDASR